MTINRNNFEAYMLDYLEGNLDPLLSADLMAFLAENPEFEKYFPDYDGNISLSDTHEYILKNSLKKDFADIPEITPRNFDEFCIAACEGLLNEPGMKRLMDYVSNHRDRQDNLELFRKLKLPVDTTIKFNGKSRLKKSPFQSRKLRYLYYTIGIAASLTFLIMLVIKKPAITEYTNRLPVETSKPKFIEPSLTPDASVASVPVAFNNTPRYSSKSPSATDPITSTQTQDGPSPREDQLLEVIEPITAIQVGPVTENAGIPAYLSETGGLARQPVTVAATGENPEDAVSETFLGALIAKVDFWKTAETAIQGFNYLTEAQLSINKTTDETGKLTGLQVGMESYEISGNKIK